MRAFFLIPPEVQLLDITGPRPLVYEAKEYGAEIDTHYLSMETSKQEISSAGLVLGNLKSFSDFSLTHNDLLFIPGLESHLFFADDF